MNELDFHMLHLLKFIDNHAMILNPILTDFRINIWNKITYSTRIWLAIVDLESTPANRQMYVVDYFLLILGNLFWTFEVAKPEFIILHLNRNQHSTKYFPSYGNIIQFTTICSYTDLSIDAQTDPC